MAAKRLDGRDSVLGLFSRGCRWAGRPAGAARTVPPASPRDRKAYSFPRVRSRERGTL